MLRLPALPADSDVDLHADSLPDLLGVGDSPLRIEQFRDRRPLGLLREGTRHYSAANQARDLDIPRSRQEQLIKRRGKPGPSCALCIHMHQTM